jgi:hypothetical protein
MLATPRRLLSSSAHQLLALPAKPTMRIACRRVATWQRAKAAMAAFAKSWRQELVPKIGKSAFGTNRKTFGPSEPYGF